MLWNITAGDKVNTVLETTKQTRQEDHCFIKWYCWMNKIAENLIHIRNYLQSTEHCTWSQTRTHTPHTKQT